MPHPPIRLTTTDHQLIQAAQGDDAQPPRLTITAYTGEPLRLAFWDLPVVIDTAGLVLDGPVIPILLEHERDIDSIIGQADSITVKPGKVIVSGQVIGDSQRVTRFLRLAAKGFAWKASVGATAVEVEDIPPDKPVIVNGREYTGPFYLVTKATLKEVSVVMLAADPHTQTVVGAAAMPEEPKPQPTREPIQAQGQPAAQPEPGGTTPQPTEPDVTPYRQKIAAELERIAQIKTIAADYPEIAARAIREGWDATKTELEILRTARTGPAIHVRDSDPAPTALEAALCLSAGLSEEKIAQTYGEKSLEAAQQKYRRAGLHTLIYETIYAAGKYARPGLIDNDTIRTAYEVDKAITAAASFSTVSLSGILSNVANKVLLESYTAVNAVAPLIALESDVPDFKQATRYRMTGLDTFDKVGPEGELKLASVNDTTFSNKAETYGVVLTLTRQAIINDDLGAFMQLPRMMGRRAAIARERALFELLLANPDNFFSAGNKNYISGADTALSIGGLTKAEQTMADQTDANGLPILVTPAILLVPTSLKVTAQQLMTETRVNETTATGKPSPANNPHAGKWQPVASPFLNAMGLAGSSATAWYLLANPQDVAAMEIVYVQGRRQPVIESGETDFKTLGMYFRAYWDFGVALQDPKAAVKAAGA